eukprot:2454177-Prymnesium_polylepis.1
MERNGSLSVPCCDLPSEHRWSARLAPSATGPSMAASRARSGRRCSTRRVTRWSTATRRCTCATSCRR